jgi:hypothetical protein
VAHHGGGAGQGAGAATIFFFFEKTRVHLGILLELLF